MARLPRYFAEDLPLHIIQRGNNREPIFGAEPDYRFYLDCLQRIHSTPFALNQRWQNAPASAILRRQRPDRQSDGGMPISISSESNQPSRKTN